MNRPKSLETITPTEDQRHAHLHHMKYVCLILAVFSLVLWFINRDWLHTYITINSPWYDTLVYQNQSYDDYWLIQEKGWSAVWNKYTDGRWHVSPLFMLSGTIWYMLFGLDPVNFYLTPALWGFVWLFAIYGFIHYWTRSAWWAALGCAMASSLPSFLIGLRTGMIEFSVGSAFTLATYLLVLCGGLKHRWLTIVYVFAVSISALLKSSIVPYYLSHLTIIALYWICQPSGWRTRLKNLTISIALGLMLTGWFFFNNFGRIVGYYTQWGGKYSGVMKAYYSIESLSDVLLFYIKSFPFYHLQGQHIFLHIYILAFVIYAFFRLIQKRSALFESGGWFPLSIAGLWLIVPYSILTMYDSKAFGVDFPFVATFYIIPLLIFYYAFQGRSRWIVLVAIAIPFLLFQSSFQVARTFVVWPIQDWKEKEVLQDILNDAEREALDRCIVSTTFIHEHLTSQNLEYYILNGTFIGKKDFYQFLPLSLYKRPEDYFQRLQKADYVLTKSDKLLPKQHPNNLISQEVNTLLEASDQFEMIKQYKLPDDTTLSVYRNKKDTASP